MTHPMHAPLPRFRRRPARARARGFTLIELFTVIAIIGVLAAIIIPVTGSVRAKARLANCTSNLRQIGQAMLLFAGDNKQMLPPRYGRGYQGADASNKLTPAHALIPYLGMEGRIGPPPLPFEEGVWICPAAGDDFAPVTRKSSYAYNAFIDNHPIPSANHWKYRLNAPSSPSRTLLLGEASANADGGYLFPGSAGGKHDPDLVRHGGNRANWLFADGHVETISGEIPVSDPRWFSKP